VGPDESVDDFDQPLKSLLPNVSVIPTTPIADAGLTANAPTRDATATDANIRGNDPKFIELSKSHSRNNLLPNFAGSRQGSLVRRRANSGAQTLDRSKCAKKTLAITIS
jgi:hypothetical protein